MEPYNQAAAALLRARPTRQTTRHVVSAAPQRIRILLADDCIANQAFIEAVLARWGIEPTIASDGEEAVKRAHFSAFDLVLMDIVMPVLDGVAATRRIRQFGRDSKTSPTVPIIAYSSLNLVRDPAMHERTGLSDVLPKPCTSASLQACIEQWCPDRVPWG